MIDDGGRKTEGRRQMTDVGEWKMEDGRRRTCVALEFRIVYRVVIKIVSLFYV